MAATKFIRPLRVPFERLFDALIDPVRADRTMALALAGYAAAWTAFAAISKSSHDIHPDMAEMAAWAGTIDLGTPKHPPLGPWLLRAWFDLFPHEDWAYYLFAMILPALALWSVWQLSARYLPQDKRVVGVALLTLVPFYNFHALKFNANSVLTPLWAATTWWFLRSFETRRWPWAALAGIGAAAAMLGKYWSAILLAGLGVAVLSDPRRGAYFDSVAPLVTLAVATVLLTPHIDWLIAHHFVTLLYAVDVHPATMLTATTSALNFLGSAVAYVALPVVLGAIAAQPNLAVIADTWWPVEPDRRQAVIAFVAPFAFAVAVALVLQVHIEALWTISAMTLLPVVLLSSPRLTIARPAAVAVLAVAVIVPPLMVLAAPVAAVATARAGVDNFQDQYRLIAQALETAWRRHTDKPLHLVGSFDSIANGAAFYLGGRPATFYISAPALSPWVDDATIRRDGVAMICPMSMDPCLGIEEGYAELYGPSAVENVTLARRFLGIAGAPVQYEIVIVPPQAR